MAVKGPDGKEIAVEGHTEDREKERVLYNQVGFQGGGRPEVELDLALHWSDQRWEERRSDKEQH